MKWFAITNRTSSGKGFKNEAQPEGRLSLLHGSGGMPDKNDVSQSSIFQTIGHSTKDEDRAVFFAEIRKELRSRRKKLEGMYPDEEDVKPVLMMYAHGYNNDWREAREELIQFRRNFQLAVGKVNFEAHVLPVLFSWPSSGHAVGYLEDRDDARASAPGVKNMVHMLYEATDDLENCISNVSIVAHSMGAYVFREAFAHLTGSAAAPAGTFVDQFILVGADIGFTSLEPGGKGYGVTRFSNRVSVYLSAYDSTLDKSKRKNGRPRLGRTLSSGYSTTPDNVLFVDCRKWAQKDRINELLEEDEFYNDEKPSVHNCYRAIPKILEDQFACLRGVGREVIPGRKELKLNKHFLIK